ncbi:MAG: hypothetical protein M1587_04510 [Thaumarchaeota archaeon]|nr:hypothetical protein [Nitrososphaerota archaeon]
MRIGTVLTSGVAMQKFDKVQQRAIIQKHIPQALQVFLFDLNYPNPATLHVEGSLVGTSQSNLATLMQQFRAICRSRQIVWIDASDAYQGRLDLVRIFNVQGPTIDSHVGILTAKFIIDAQILPPWGTTHTNPWKAAGIYFRDLNNVGREYSLNPLMNHCNFTIDNVNKNFSWEFIVDNQNPFTNAASVQETDCDTLGNGTPSSSNPVAITPFGGYTGFDSLSIDSVNYMSGSGSLKATKSSPAASTNYGFGYDFGTSGINISNYDRIRMWFRCDQTGLNYTIIIFDTSNYYRLWNFTLQGANVWMNLEFAISAYSSQSATPPNFAAIRYIGIRLSTNSAPPSVMNSWIDDIRFEVGYVSHCEDTSGWTASTINYPNGTGITFSNDSAIFKSSYSGAGAVSLPSGAAAETSKTASVKINGTTDATYGEMAGRYILPVGPWNLSNYDFIVFWFRSDFAGASSANMTFVLQTSAGNYWDNGSSVKLNANQWYRFVLPLRSWAYTYGSPTLSSIIAIQFGITATGKPSTTANIWVDEIAFEVGNWATLEMMVPDNVSQTKGNAAVMQSTWDGSQYNTDIEWGTYSNTGINISAFKFLDGSEANVIYPASTRPYWEGAFEIGTVGTTPQALVNMNGSPPITYTTTYGCNNRMAIAIKMPPATSDSQSGNYPSNDISGFQAINKVRLKLQVYYSNEDTAYIGI